MGPAKQRRKTARRKARQKALAHLANAKALRRRALIGSRGHQEIMMVAAAAQMGMAVGAFRKGWGGPRNPTPSTD